MKNKVTRDLGLKIISVLVGILIWLIVSNIENPVISRSFTVSNVELLNEAYIDETGKVCLRDGGETPVRVTITGTTKLLKGITAEDIRVVADLQQAVSLDTDPVMIPLSATCDRISASNISVSPQNLRVTLEDKVTSEFLVAVSNSTSPGKGYEIGTQTVNPEKVRITGPESLIKKIDKVVVYPNVQGATSDQTEEVSVVVIDKNGDRLSDVAMSNLKFDSEGKVEVTTKLWNIRTDVELDTVYYGEPTYGYVVDKITTVPETISLAGTKEALENLKEQGNVLKIEDTSVDVSGASEDVELRVSITEFLPENTKLTSGSSDEVLITVSILPDGGKSFDLPTSQIHVIDRPEGLQASFQVDRVEIRVKAVDDSVSIDEFDVDALEAYIDLGEITEGTQEVPVSIRLPEGYELISEVTAEITVSQVSVLPEDAQS